MNVVATAHNTAAPIPCRLAFRALCSSKMAGQHNRWRGPSRPAVGGGGTEMDSGPRPPAVKLYPQSHFSTSEGLRHLQRGQFVSTPRKMLVAA
jgi:hypothetical protein